MKTSKNASFQKLFVTWTKNARERKSQKLLFFKPWIIPFLPAKYLARQVQAKPENGHESYLINFNKCHFYAEKVAYVCWKVNCKSKFCLFSVTFTTIDNIHMFLLKKHWRRRQLNFYFWKNMSKKSIFPLLTNPTLVSMQISCSFIIEIKSRAKNFLWKLGESNHIAGL